MAITSISHMSSMALRGRQEAAPQPATGQAADAKQTTARPAIGGPLSGRTGVVPRTGYDPDFSGCGPAHSPACDS